MKRLIAAVFIVTACDEPSAPPGAPIAVLTVEPASVQLLPGDTQRFVPIALDANGAPMRDVKFVWQSTDTAKVQIDSTGLATARAGGQLIVRVLARNQVAESAVEVCQITGHRTGSRFKVGFRAGWFPSGEPSNGSLDGVPVFWGGSLMFGSSTTDFVSTVTDYFPTFYVTNTPICISRIERGEYTRTRLDIRTPAPIPPVEVTQETLAFDDAPLNQFVLLRYTFRNYSNAPVNGLRVGLKLDWDLWPSLQDDVATYDAEFDAAITSDQSGMIAGVASVTSSISSQMRVRAPEPFDFRQVYTWLNPGTSGTVAGTSDDRQYVGFGELNIPPGEARSIIVAMLAAHSRAEFGSVVAWARASADHFPQR